MSCSAFRALASPSPPLCGVKRIKKDFRPNRQLDNDYNATHRTGGMYTTLTRRSSVCYLARLVTPPRPLPPSVNRGRSTAIGQPRSVNRDRSTLPVISRPRRYRPGWRRSNLPMVLAVFAPRWSLACPPPPGPLPSSAPCRSACPHSCGGAPG